MPDRPGRTSRPRADGRRRPFSAEGGFTVVEIVVTLVVLGVVIGIAAPRFDTARARADGAALRVTSLLMTAQRRSVLRQHDVRLVFDTEKERVVLHDDANNDGARSDGEAWRVEELGDGVAFGTAGTPRVAVPEDGPVTFDVDPDEGLPVVTFHRNGSASQEGVVYVTSPSNAAATDTRAVSVERSTGRTTCWTYRTGAWKEGC